MPKVMLRLRDLSTGEPRTHECSSVDDAVGWLSQRPAMVDVLGVVFEGISHEDNDRMKRAMRPLDETEQTKSKALEEREAAERAERAAQRKKEAEADAQRLRDEAKKASPDRPMELLYRFDTPELKKTDLLDDRDISDAAKEAVMEWVKERMEWVEPRGQTIGEAKVTVYPTTVPKGKDRVVQGTFVPVTAAAKP